MHVRHVKRFRFADIRGFGAAHVVNERRQSQREDAARNGKVPALDRPGYPGALFAGSRDLAPHAGKESAGVVSGGHWLAGSGGGGGTEAEQEGARSLRLAQTACAAAAPLGVTGQIAWQARSDLAGMAIPMQLKISEELPTTHKRFLLLAAMSFCRARKSLTLTVFSFSPTIFATSSIE